MVTIGKSLPGVWKQRMLAQSLAGSNANGRYWLYILLSFYRVARTLLEFTPRSRYRCTFWFWRVANHVPLRPAVARFKLFLEPHALRDPGAMDPRLSSLPVRVSTSNSRPLYLERDTVTANLTAFDDFVYSPARQL